MQKTLLSLAAAAALLASAPLQAADKIKIGLLSTLSGPGSGLGVDVRDGFALALKHSGGKIGDLPAELIVADDQQSPDAAKQTAQRLLKRDKVDFMTGIIFSNIMLAVGPQVFQAKTFYISPNAGPSQLAGEKCSPYFFNVSTQNDNLHEAVGKIVSEKGFKKVALLAPNYPAGKDSLAGFKRFYQGEVVLESYTPLGQLDYGSELSKIRASGADAVYIFLPGGLGVNFIKQFAGAGLNREMKLFAPGFSADEDVISAVGENMLGIFNGSNWAYDLDNEANKKFVADFQQEYGRMPTLYASQGYDAARLIDSAVRKVEGKIEDKAALHQALAAAEFDSVRGAFRFGSNQFPVQDYWLREVVKKEDGGITNRTLEKIFEGHSDAYAGECKLPKL